MANSIARIRKEFPLNQHLRNEWLGKPLISTWAGWLADVESMPAGAMDSLGFKLLTMVIRGPEHSYNLFSIQYDDGSRIFTNLLHPENLVPDTNNWTQFSDDVAHRVPEEMDLLMRRKIIYYSGAIGYFEVSDLFIALVKEIQHKDPLKPTRAIF